jgi:type II restriction/modification system DNA methylase subunit YeeA
MNKTKLKAYAPQARKDFIAAVTARANQLGLTATKGELAVATATRQGDVTLIEGREWPINVYAQRENLIKWMQREGFEQVVEAVAYTWFNRFAALRYMELHDYLCHGYRVLSSTAAGSGAHTPDILLHAVDLAQSQALPGLKAESVNQLKLAGNQDAELYRRLLIAQCNTLSNAMPFLFERIDDETELLLPDNLLRTDSVIAKLVDEIPEEDWVQVEIVGWLYQFYISEKKDQVIGKVVKSEDIPAATQLFTPNWIVQYLVQNSVGRLWMMANPQSTLKSQWPYYIEPAEQTAEVNAQLDALIKTRMDEDGGSLNPESITVLDPACGSGHILVEAYELLKGIYLERGYRLRDIPRLILEKNLYGLDIDDRAAQMAGFALMMKARADDRRLLEEPIALNVLSLQESKGLPQEEIAVALAPYGVSAEVVKALLITFEHAKTFGSLIQIPESLNEQLPKLADALSNASKSGDLYAHQAANDLLPLVWQGLLLGRQYDAVAANPPYMGGKYHTSIVKSFLKLRYSGFDKDLFSAFMARNTYFGKSYSEIAVMTSNVWMFLSSFESMRNWIINEKSLNSLIQLSNSGFEGATVFVCAFTYTNQVIGKNNASFVRLTEFARVEDQSIKTREAIEYRDCGWFYTAKPDDFKKIPGYPIAYWVSAGIKNVFEKLPNLSEVADAVVGLQTGDNGRFLRLWHEVDISRIGFEIENRKEASKSSKKWFPYNKGGEYRRWFGNQDWVVNWEEDGNEVRNFGAVHGSKPRSRAQNVEYYFQPSVSWSFISSSYFGVRYFPKGFIFDVAGSSAFPNQSLSHLDLASFLCSAVAPKLMSVLNPTLNFQAGNVGQLPFMRVDACNIGERCIEISRCDWNKFETSWNFGSLDLQLSDSRPKLLSAWWQVQRELSDQKFDEMKLLEEENNRIFINAYGLKDELSHEVPEEQITLARADREKDCQRLVSYAVGCIMGRYSLNQLGLIYANSGNVGFDPTCYQTYPADADGIVPITEELWFEDDAANRVREFLVAVWGTDTVDENLTWLAESLGKKESESSEQSIRRYLADKFYKDHLQTYKKRPIYWLFSSGKQGAFQALVYLHRYHEGTLARMRAEYVVPLTGKIQARIDLLQKDAESAASTSARNKINKEIEKLRKQHVELLAYDEKLRHYADMRIKLDLDDGVKVNYGKFGDLLAEVKAVTGGASDD